MRSSVPGVSRCLAALLVGLPLVASGQPMDKMAVPVCVNGYCGVVDQDGKVLLAFENDFNNVYSNRPGQAVFVATSSDTGGQWHLVTSDGKTRLKGPYASLIPLTPGHYAVSNGRKTGVIDDQGNELQPMRFDEVYTVGLEGRQVVVYEMGGKQGILSATGKKLTEPVYTEVMSGTARLAFAQRGGKQWMINLESGAQRAVAYDSVSQPSPDGMVIARNTAKQVHALIDEHGKERIPPGKYRALHWAGPGYVSFRHQSDGPCGYADYAGKVMIPAKFAECGSFGKAGALAQERLADGKAGKFGLIGRQGEWLLSPRYDAASEAGLSVFGQAAINHVAGYAAIAQQPNLLTVKYGLFSTDDGKELLAPTRQLAGVLTPELFAYSNDDAPQVKVNFMGSVDVLPAVGLMDRAGKPLLAPKNYIGFVLHDSGRFLLAHEGIGADAKVALLDLRGKELIAPQWQQLEVNTERGYVLAYEVYFDENDTKQTELRALFDLSGRPVFVVKQIDCGAQQLVDGAGQPVWPANPAEYCPEQQ